MNTENPLISVIIPVYNGELYLAEAIESVLAQTYQPVELILIDDGSTDRTAEIARSFEPPLRYAYQPNSGVCAARNHGIRLAKGEFLAFLDADDLWVKEKLELQMGVLQQDEQVEAVYAHARQFYSPDLSAELRARIACNENPLPGYMSTLMLIRKETFLRYGEFNPELKVAEQFDWFPRAREKGLKLVMLPQTLYLRRLHARNKGRSELNQRSQLAHLIKASLDRRRQAASGGERASGDQAASGEKGSAG
jgi:glycosyltransferase involved in cell wall biosynthesis